MSEQSDSDSFDELPTNGRQGAKNRYLKAHPNCFALCVLCQRKYECWVCALGCDVMTPEEEAMDPHHTASGTHCDVSLSSDRKTLTGGYGSNYDYCTLQISRQLQKEWSDDARRRANLGCIDSEDLFCDQCVQHLLDKKRLRIIRE